MCLSTGGSVVSNFSGGWGVVSNFLGEGVVSNFSGGCLQFFRGVWSPIFQGLQPEYGQCLAGMHPTGITFSGGLGVVSNFLGVWSPIFLGEGVWSPIFWGRGVVSNFSGRCLQFFRGCGLQFFRGDSNRNTVNVRPVCILLELHFLGGVGVVSNFLGVWSPIFQGGVSNFLGGVVSNFSGGSPTRIPSTFGWYASYWNAFLFQMFSLNSVTRWYPQGIQKLVSTYDQFSGG